MVQRKVTKKEKNKRKEQSSPYKKRGEEAAVFVLLLLSVFLYGGFYEFTGAMFAAVFGVLLILWRVKRSFRIRGKKQLFLLFFVFLWFGITCFYAVDRAMAFVGMVKMLPLFLGYLLCMQLSDTERETALAVVVPIGCLVVLTGIAALPFPALKEQFWQADRLGGFFQYSNTCALYLLAGIVILFHQWMEKTKEQGWKEREKAVLAAEGVLLLAGLLLTGSRGTMLLFFGYLVWFIRHLSSKKAKRYALAGLAGLIAFLLIMLFATNGAAGQNVGRIFTIFSYSSTWKGRILYDLDALKMIAKHPFGMGYLGYSYVQGQMQTGVYQTMFVHNDWLQAALDLGIFPALLFAGILLRQLLKGKQSSLQKQILLLLVLHMLVEFDLQFLAVGFLGLLCLDYGEEAGTLKRKTKVEDCIFLAVLSAGCIYFSVPFFLHYAGADQAALNFYSVYTPAQIAVMEQSQSEKEALQAAEQIRSHNPSIAEVYQYLAYAAQEEGKDKESLDYMAQAISCDIYASELYDEYEEMLKQAESLTEGEKKEHQNWIRNKKQEVLEQTSKIAYELNDKPQISVE